VRLEYRHARADQAQRAAQTLAGKISQWLAQEQASVTELIGPAPCYFERISGMYRWQIILRGPDPARLLRPQALNDWHVEVDPPSLL
jgi:primosomal protein N' (replication factor Y)